VSGTNPGVTRGEHYHLSKVERFVVLRGEAVIRLRRLLHDDVLTFRVSGAVPAVVDMPTMWAHNITNIGSDELLTLFWSNDLFDPGQPDTYPEAVTP
jgi:UDP-2-acetamido-2,6-beta-L-arabino-hexul-4-ose reductase